MPDKYQLELSRTLAKAGFYTLKIPDFHFGNNSEKSYPDSGRPDNFFMANGIGGFVEAKTGRGEYQQRWPFAEWRDSQRQWYQTVAVAKHIPYYLFITVGKRIDAVKYPRITVLLPADTLINIEQNTDRKSLSYEELRDMTYCRLQWAGKQTWTIPKFHIFRTRIMQRKTA
jgi:hypothetical protein